MTKASLTKIAILVNRQMTEKAYHMAAAEIFVYVTCVDSRAGSLPSSCHTGRVRHSTGAPMETTTTTRTGERMIAVVQSNRAPYTCAVGPNIGSGVALPSAVGRL